MNRQIKPVPKSFNFPQQIERNDIKPYPFAANNLPNTMKNLASQTASPRSLIISADTNRVDQSKSGSFISQQYSPGLFLSSTTEPAIPILRLSNEMDLDGSFSYEALGADQTHYVQHSHMENVGTDKEEQVVEGSYSYVGDNGQTYTVHYIADSNGFRATGEHLPVPPPVPEIIQRSVQYNLAEEARNPTNQINSWENGVNDNEIDKLRHFVFSPPQNLFTGKTPESFSHAFSQPSNKQNNLIAAASTNSAVKTVDYKQDLPKNNAETISPQITFVASQGTHIPSRAKSQQQTQQTISRMFTTDKTMPQLMNYEATIKDAEQENNKALWRWQYGLPPNNDQSSDKNTISRSSGDDVIIDFNDMTPEQYSNMIKTEIQYSKEQENVNNTAPVFKNNDNELSHYTTVSSVNAVQLENWNKHFKSNYKLNIPSSTVPTKTNQEQSRYDGRAKLITLTEFLPPSQTITQSYDYFDTNETRQINSEDINNLYVIPINKTEAPHYWSTDNSFENLQSAHFSNQKDNSKLIIKTDNQFKDFNVKETDLNVKPMHGTIKMNTMDQSQESTTEAKIEDSLKENIFLKNMFNRKTKEQSDLKTNKEEIENNLKTKYNTEVKSDKSVKYFAIPSRPFEETKGLRNKPIDMIDLVNFMSPKSNFESSKIKPREKSGFHYNNKNVERFIPLSDQKDDSEKYDIGYSDWNHQQREELKGLIKNYKVLQRNNNGLNHGDRMDHLRTILTPSPGSTQLSNLPPLGRAGPSMKSYLPPIYV